VHLRWGAVRFVQNGTVKFHATIAFRIVPMQGDARGVSWHEINKYGRRIRQNQPDDDNDSSRRSCVIGQNGRDKACLPCMGHPRCDPVLPRSANPSLHGRSRQSFRSAMTIATRQIKQHEGARLSVPRRGHALSRAVEVFGGPIREAVTTITADLRPNTAAFPRSMISVLDRHRCC
jgi:hypothetical protein